RAAAGYYRTTRVELGTSEFADGRVGIGRVLFHASGDRRISKDGRACASCHPEGRDDGLTWPSPLGARQTPMLAGRVDETRLDRSMLRERVKASVGRLGGTGLDDVKLDALAAYLATM